MRGSKFAIGMELILNGMKISFVPSENAILIANILETRGFRARWPWINRNFAGGRVYQKPLCRSRKSIVAATIPFQYFTLVYIASRVLQHALLTNTNTTVKIHFASSSPDMEYKLLVSNITARNSGFIERRKLLE